MTNARSPFRVAHTPAPWAYLPTDESVKLLKEFEDAADKRRIETLQLTNNAFSGKVFLEELAYHGETRARCVCDLNGHRITVDVQRSIFDRDDPLTLLTELRDKLAVRIASEVLTEIASGTLTEWQRRSSGSGRSLSGAVPKADAQ